MKQLTLEEILLESLPQAYLSCLSQDILKSKFEVEEITDISSFLAENYQRPLRTSRAGESRRKEWNDGWSSSGVVIDASLGPLPFYFKSSTHLRTAKSVYRDYTGYLEYHVLMNFQRAIFSTYFDKNSVDTICEYGCGIGSNLRNLASIFPNHKFYGADWAESAREYVNSDRIRQLKDFFNLNFFEFSTFKTPPDPFIAFTNAALEQTGDRFVPFLDYLLDEKLCLGGIHIEPIVELLNPFDARDKQSIEYASSRNYLRGLPTYFLQRYDVDLYMKNYGIGSRYLSGYQLLIWKKKD
jgi:hypothetical protein